MLISQDHKELLNKHIKVTDVLKQQGHKYLYVT